MPGVGGQSAGGHAPALKSLGTWSPAELAGGGGGGTTVTQQQPS